MNIEEIYKIVPNKNGWRILPNGDYIKLGYNVSVSDSATIGSYAEIGDVATIGDNAKIGEGAKIGNDVTISYYVTIGNSAKIGDYAIIGDYATICDGAKIGDYAKIGDGADIGNSAKIGNGADIGNSAKIGNSATVDDGATIGNGAIIGEGATIGNYAKIGNGATIGNSAEIGNYAKIGNNDSTEAINKRKISSFPEKMIFWKWVTKDLISSWCMSTPLKYEIGSVVEEPNAVVSDQQCDIGLHVMIIGVRPEELGLCEPNHNFICLEVEVNREDICFGGLPGNLGKLRVKKLRVLRKIDLQT